MKGAESGGGELLGAVSCHRHWRALEEEGKDIDRGHALDAGKWQLPTAVRFPTSSEGLEILLAT